MADIYQRGMTPKDAVEFVNMVTGLWFDAATAYKIAIFPDVIAVYMRWQHLESRAK